MPKCDMWLVCKCLWWREMCLLSCHQKFHQVPHSVNYVRAFLKGNIYRKTQYMAKHPGKEVVSGRFSLQPLHWIITYNQEVSCCESAGNACRIQPHPLTTCLASNHGFLRHHSDDLATKLQSLRLATGKGRIESIDFFQPATLLLGPHHLVSSLGLVSSQGEFSIHWNPARLSWQWGRHGRLTMQWLGIDSIAWVPDMCLSCQGIPSPIVLGNFHQFLSIFNHHYSISFHFGLS